MVALIHPKNPNVIYFILEQHLFGVDVRARKVVECEVYELVAPPSDYIANRFVRTWELPQVLSSGNATLLPVSSLYILNYCPVGMFAVY